MSQAADLEHLVQATLERFRRLDVVLANAGVGYESPVVELDLDVLDRCPAVNVRGPLLLCKYALAPLMALSQVLL